MPTEYPLQNKEALPKVSLAVLRYSTTRASYHAEKGIDYVSKLCRISDAGFTLANPAYRILGVYRGRGNVSVLMHL